MLSDIIPENLFIFDIETVPGVKDFHELPEHFQKLFDDKVGRFRKEEEDSAAFYKSRAGIYAEFGKVVVISCGHIQKQNNTYQIRIKTLSNHDEKQLLSDFTEVLNKIFVHKNQFCLCGHNIKEFDVPWLCRRMLINGMRLPDILDLSGKKPWEVNHLDTLDLWKFGDYKHYTSLNLLAAILNVPSPKDDIDGSMVGKVYYEENDLERIALYCSKDVLTVAQVIMRIKGVELIRQEDIFYV